MPSSLYFRIILLLFAPLFLEAQSIVQSLDGDQWRLKNPYDKVIFPATVPGNVFTDLMEAGLIPDPYIGTNEAYVQWVSQRDWSYERIVEPVDPMFTRMDVQELVLEGVDTYAWVYWNGKLLGHCENAFRSYRFSLKGLVKKQNTLRVIFRSAEHLEKQKEKDHGMPMPGGTRVFTRKPAFHYGWDWGPKLTGMGLTGKVHLEAWSGIQIESGIPVVDRYSEHELEGHALLYVRSSVSGQLSTTISMDGQKVASGHILPITYGQQIIRVPFRVTRPRLWWTWDLGDPKLYDVRIDFEIMADLPFIQLIKSHDQFKWGLRQVSLRTPEDSTGSAFYLELNGVPVFARGANYIPQHLFLHRVTEDRYARLFTDVRAANMNTLRVWGGGLYEKDRFYTYCDSLGLLVWQDFMFACAMYPGDSSFLDNVKKEAGEQVLRLSAHPSLALWCGNNENAEGWARWGWQEGYDPGQRKSISKAYQDLFGDLLPSVVDSLSGGISYWESSPKWGRGDIRFDREGDAHDWGVWHDGMPFDRFEKRVPRFMSEYGFQAWPGPAVVRDFYRDEDSIMALDQHQKHPRGFRIMEEYRQRDFPEPVDLLDTIYISQLVQARGMVTGAEAHRLARPYCMGSLYWQLNDCWPVISWSGMDHQGHWKAMHSMMSDAFEPVMFTLKSRNDTLELWGVNDTRKLYLDTVRVHWWMDGAMPLAVRSVPVTVHPGQAVRLAEFSGGFMTENGDSARIMITLQTGDRPAHRVYLIVRPKNYTGVHQPLQLHCKDSKNGQKEIVLTSESVHTAIYLPPDILFDPSSNFQTVVPGHPVRLRARACPDPEEIRSFPIRKAP